MSEYRKEFDEVHADTKWTFWKVLPFLLVVVVVLGVVFSSLNVLSQPGRALERFC